MAKRGQGGIITTILIILLVLAVVVIVWQVIKGTVEKGAEEVETFSQISDIKIREIVIDAENSQIEVVVQKGESAGTLEKIKVVVKNSAGESQVETIDAGIGTLETKKIKFAITIADPSEVEIYPVLTAEDGSEKIGQIADTMKRSSRNFKTSAEAAGETACADSCSSLGYQCGIQTICGASANCGACANGGICDSTAGQCILLGGLAGYWSFDNPETITDDSIYNNDCNKKNSISCLNTGGKFGGACIFDGIDDYLACGTALPNLQSFTLSAWIKPDIQSGNWKVVVGKATDTVNIWKIGFGLNNANKVQTWIANDAGATAGLLGNSAIGTSGWSHIAIVNDIPNNKRIIYVNGVADSSLTTAALTPTANAGAKAYIGTIPDLINNYYFKGAIDEVRIYSKALSEGEISALYQQAA